MKYTETNLCQAAPLVEAQSLVALQT